MAVLDQISSEIFKFDAFKSHVEHLPGSRFVGDRWHNDRVFLVVVNASGDDLDDYPLTRSVKASFPFVNVDENRLVAAVPEIALELLQYHTDEGSPYVMFETPADPGPFGPQVRTLAHLTAVFHWICLSDVTEAQQAADSVGVPVETFTEVMFAVAGFAEGEDEAPDPLELYPAVRSTFHEPSEGGV